jgi:hypothetical protein
MEVAPLQELMGEIMRITGSAKTSKLRSVQLKEIWKEEHSKCFERISIGRHCDTDAERRLGLRYLGAETRTSGISQWNFQQISEALAV